MSNATTHIETEKRSSERSRSKLVPALRFNEFEGDIKESFFGNHYTFHITNSLSRDKLNYDKGEVRNIHYGDIHTKFQTHFHLTKEYVPFINEDEDLAKIKEDSYCKIGDLVIADASEDYADIGKSIELIDINNEKLLAGLHTFLARPSSESTAIGYISCLLKSWKLRKQIMTIAQGTKVLSLSTGRVSKLKLNLPTFPEQQKIASFLSAVDEKIQQLTKKKAFLEQYKKGVMQQLFAGQLRFKDENGYPYPDWEKKRLKDLVEKERKIRYGIVQPGAYDPTGRFMIRGQDYSSVKGWAASSEFFKVSDIVEQKYKKARVKSGDLLITIVGAGTGWLEVVPSFLEGANITQTTGRIAINNSVASPGYVKNYFFSYAGRKEINGYIKGQAQPGLNIGDVEIFKLPLPCLEEQQKIATYLSRIDTKIESVTNQMTETQTFKKGLLQQMFV